jgi:hypothetical protein
MAFETTGRRPVLNNLCSPHYIDSLIVIAERAMRNRQTEEVPVTFDMECDDFGVEKWRGLRVSATYRFTGFVYADKSGDSLTPNGPPYVEINSELVNWTIYLVTDDLAVELPEWLQAHLVVEFADELDEAFVAAKGGQARIEWQAIERAGV